MLETHNPDCIILISTVDTFNSRGTILYLFISAILLGYDYLVEYRKKIKSIWRLTKYWYYYPQYKSSHLQCIKKSKYQTVYLGESFNYKGGQPCWPSFLIIPSPDTIGSGRVPVLQLLVISALHIGHSSSLKLGVRLWAVSKVLEQVYVRYQTNHILFPATWNKRLVFFKMWAFKETFGVVSSDHPFAGKHCWYLLS